MSSASVIVFDVGSTLIHPNFETLTQWLTDNTGIIVATPTVAHAFRRAIGGNIFKRSADPISDQAATFFGVCGLTATLDDEQALRLWTEIAESGGFRSWLYTAVDAEAKNTLKGLKAIGKRLIAASNCNGTTEAMLNSFDLSHFFDEVYDSALLGVEKPNELFYEMVLASSQGMTSLHVGDDLIKDCIAAAAFGFDQVLLYDPQDLYLGLPAHIRITSLLEVGRKVKVGS